MSSYSDDVDLVCSGCLMRYGVKIDGSLRKHNRKLRSGNIVTCFGSHKYPVPDGSQAFTVECAESDSREIWLAERMTGIGASEAAGAVGESPWESPLSIYVEKRGGEAGEENEAMRWGKLTEPLIRAEYSRESERECRDEGLLLRSVDYPWMLCTTDGFTRRDSVFGCFEAKNKRYAPDPLHIPSRRDWVQMQQQMAVTGLSFTAYAFLVSGQAFYWYDVERDGSFINDTLIPKTMDLWARIGAGEPPSAADSSEATASALAKLYPVDDGERIVLPASFCDLEEDRREVVTRVRAAEAEKLKIDNTFKEAIGSHSEAVLTSGEKYTYRANKNGVRVFRAPAIPEEYGE